MTASPIDGLLYYIHYSEFWESRQGPDEKTCEYVEEKARFARRLRLPDEQFVVQGAIQGIRVDIRRDVLVQRPTTIQALRTAADIADTNARTAGGGQLKSDAP